MKCIEDIEKHVASIFDIKNFHLMSENQYLLPPTEDVRILDSDEIIWVVPGNSKTYLNGNSAASPELEEVSKVKKKKTKKKLKSVNGKDDDVCQKSECEMELEETSPVKKKQKKKNKHTADESLDLISSIKSKKTKYAKREDSYVSENVNKKQSFDTQSLEIEKSDHDYENNNETVMDNTYTKGKNCGVKSLVNVFESRKTSFHPQPLNICENTKKINIVKTIIISNEKEIAVDKNSETCNNKDVDISCEQNGFNTSITTGEKPVVEPDATLKMDENLNNLEISSSVDLQSQTSFDPQLKTSQRSSYAETLSNFSCSSNVTEMYANVNKRKRRRTHKKKRNPGKNECNDTLDRAENFTDNIPTTQYTTSTPNHIRFDNQESRKICSVTNEPKVSTTYNGTVETNRSRDNDEKTKYEDATVDSVKRPFTEQQIDYILKQPITSNIEPRIGDVIAFKILRISENYTPEVSSTIVGKVIRYKPEDKGVTFEVLHGHEQCALPNGKFSLNHDEESEKETNDKFQCVWPSLLEPRLIFP